VTSFDRTDDAVPAGLPDSVQMAILPRAPAPPVTADQANDDARRASQRAGVEIRTLHEPEEHAGAADLAARVWRSSDTSALDKSLLRALAHTGNFVVGAFAGDELVGLSVGFRTGHPVAGLHSHMTCTAEDRRGAGLGYALKLHQRAWALAEGLVTITWTFDPLARHNAFFNLVKLGAQVHQYLPDFYGPMSDGLNAGDESDRLLMSWDIASGPVTAREDGFAAAAGTLRLSTSPDGQPLPLTSGAAEVGCQVPPDIIGLRTTDPGLALRWRRELRVALLGAFADGYRITGFTRSGYYVLSRDRTR
jgi:predicted GNAT superfamily acetyltransferase